MQKELRLYKSIIDTSNRIYIATDENGVIRFFNKIAEDLLGYKKEEVIGIFKATDFMDPKDIKEMAKILSESLGYEIKPGIENFFAIASLNLEKFIPANFVKKNGQRLSVEVKVKALYDNCNLIGYLGLANNLQKPIEQNRIDKIVNLLNNYENKIKEKNLEVKNLEEEAKIANLANSNKSDFLASISHEIRTPLTGILGILEVMLEDEKLSFEQKQNLTLIESSTKTLNQLIDDLLDLSKIESGKFALNLENFNLYNFLDECLAGFKLITEKKGLDFNFNIAKNVPKYLYADNLRICQIIRNLVNNAIKFTKKGFIKINISAKKRDFNKLILIIEVIDSGIGIPKEKLNFLFQRFSQTDIKTSRIYGGTGLGLAISKHLAELMNGFIEVSSEINKGTNFTCLIEVEEGSFKEEVLDNQTKKTNINSYNILLAEDNQINQKFIAHFLLNAKHNLTIVNNGLEALEQAIKHNFDLVLMDIQMPNMDGLEASKLIKQKKPKLPIIALTAYAMKNEQEKFLKVGIDAYLSKPLRSTELLNKIDEVVLLKKASITINKEINYEVFDSKDLLKQFNNNSVFLKELLNNYLVSLEEIITKLKIAIYNKDFANLDYSLHGLTAASGSVCANKLWHHLNKLENNLYKPDLNYYLDLLNLCEETFNQIKVY